MRHVDAGRRNVGDVSLLVLDEQRAIGIEVLREIVSRDCSQPTLGLCRSDVAQTSRQLWTATTVSNRNTERGTAQARTLDAEFLRVLAGTHNVSEAFRRAGLQNKSTSGWLLHIPDQTTSMNAETIHQKANELLNGLGLSKTSESLEINLDGAKNLGISLDETIDASRIEASLIGHILLADVSSSQ